MSEETRQKISAGELMTKVFMVDLLSLSPFYDRYLYKALRQRISEFEFFAISFPYEKNYFSKSGVTLSRRILGG